VIQIRAAFVGRNGRFDDARRRAAAAQRRSGGTIRNGCAASLAEPNGIGTHARNASRHTNAAVSATVRIEAL
jgi:hypothetical protein